MLLQLILDHLHPHHEHPNNSVAAVTEYAHANGWVAVHIGQFFGVLLLAFALLVLCRPLARQPGLAGALAGASGVAVVLLTGVFAVQMAVDGVALSHAVNAWASATGTARTSALQVAETVRSLEKGLSGFFHLMNGIALVALGASIVAGRAYPSWLGHCWSPALSRDAHAPAGSGSPPVSTTAILAPSSPSQSLAIWVRPSPIAIVAVAVYKLPSRPGRAPALARIAGAGSEGRCAAIMSLGSIAITYRSLGSYDPPPAPTLTTVRAVLGAV